MTVGWLFMGFSSVVCQNNFRIEGLFPCFFPFTFFIRNTNSSWDSSRCRSDGRKPGLEWKLSHLFQESRFSKMQKQPQNCCINIKESLDARKFGFVIEGSTKQQPKYSSLNKSVFERLYNISSCDPKYGFKNLLFNMNFLSLWSQWSSWADFCYAHSIRLNLLHRVGGVALYESSSSRVNLSAEVFNKSQTVLGLWNCSYLYIPLDTWASLWFHN